MTEYWKSQSRKYCEFCKCWFADNKVSISFHENGKRHKENVQKHISQLTKKSAKEAKQKDKIDDEMKKMEEAAMAAYLKDVQNNADLTSQAINNMLDQTGSTVTTKNASISTASSKTEKIPPVWQEVKNDNGGTYFWNTQTNETTWDPPDEYLSIAQQEEQKLKEAQDEKRKEKQKKQKEKESFKEAKAYIAREKMKELSVKKDPAPVRSEASSVSYGPAPRAAKPYGAWTPVVNEPVEQVDLQLPKVKEVAPPPVEVTPEVVKFGEKRVESLGEGPVEFKRRKIGNAKRNMRQKVDDE
ncbi:WW domain-binding protein 4 [Pectinophora gossypiella]|nr:WW domain-binding protein 4 [Pectinophora gossypiella]